MPDVDLRLFGPGSLTCDGKAVRPHSAKAFALLAVLAAAPDRLHARATLTELIWGETSSAAARHSLRQALHSLKTLGDGVLDGHIVADRESIRFEPGAGLRVDLQRFVACAESPDPRDWPEAASLYVGPLLEGRVFEDSGALEQWLESARERLHALATRNLDRLIAHCIGHAELDAALGYADRLRELDDASERCARHLFRIHAARRDPRGIEAEWSRLSNAIRVQFGTVPSAQTLAAYVSLLAECGSAPATVPPRALPVAPSTQVRPQEAGDAEGFVRAARAAEGVHAYGNAIDLYVRALRIIERGRPGTSKRLCEVLLLKEAVLERLGRRAEQSETVEAALEIAVSLEDPAVLAMVLMRQAGVLAYQGQGHGAAESARRALGIYRGLLDRPGEAEALRELGFVHWRTSEYELAIEVSREALALHRQAGDIAGEASALHNLAEIHRGLGSPAQAMEWYERALALHWATGNREGEILTLFGMGGALQLAGDPVGARARYQAAVGTSERHGERTMQARALHALAMLCIDQDDLDGAIGLMERALAIDRAIGYAHALGHDLVDLCALHLRRGEKAQARSTLQEALVWFVCTDDSDAVTEARVALERFDEHAADPSRIVPRRSGVKSHVSLSEGKVYCAFESPLARSRTNPQA
jgi:DNA-binding SARP family transcriptional activator/Tfp pilus assembly protein PilF